MQEIIDVASDVTEFAGRLKQAGVKAVIRYYNHRNSTRLPTKCLTPAEAQALRGAGLAIAAVFEQRAGARLSHEDSSHIEDFGADNGVADANRALELAGEIEQPKGSAIYFAVDFDFAAASAIEQITAYFEKVKGALTGQYLVGVYGSGKVGQHLQSRRLVDHMWLAGSRGWSGFDDAMAAGQWSLFQRDLDQASSIGHFSFGGDVANPTFDNFGQFGSDGVLAPQPAPPGPGSLALFKVAARSGLNLRSGPGETFKILDTVPDGAIVTGKGLEGSWMQVDLGGDGHLDGYMFASFLKPVSGGLPLPVPPSAPATHVQPIDVARAELDRNIREIPGPQNNPRIVLYHSTTIGGAAPDETAWCSSFVNYCVEQAGLQGTDSKAALSWDEPGWGHVVTEAPAEGDIAVFRRRAGSSTGQILGGHVGFFISQDGGAGKVQVLGGNQSQRISIAPFPKDGVSNGTHYKLLSIRRA